MRISDWSSDVCSSDLNEKFSDGDLKDEMATRTTGGLLSFLSSNTTYDPDRLAYDQQKLRLFYLQNGYADFRVISAVAELTSNKQDLLITYVVEEGQRHRSEERRGGKKGVSTCRTRW